MDQNFIYVNNNDINRTIITINTGYGYKTQQLSVQQLLNHRNNLMRENFQLKNQLSFNVKYFEDTKILLTNRIDNLLEQIDYLMSENQNLQKELQNRNEDIKNLNTKLQNSDEQIVILSNKVDQLMNDKEDIKNIMITAESVILFDRIIVNSIFDNENKYTLSDIILNKIKLNDNESKKWNIFKKEVKIDPKKLLWYLCRLKDERNVECHEKYRDPKLTIDMIKDIMIKYVESNKNEQHLRGYNKVINFLVKKLEDEKGINPFKLSEEAPEI